MEENRIKPEDLVDHPFISDEMIGFNLNDIDLVDFNSKAGGKDDFSDMTSDNGSCMLSRFDESEIHEEDIILTSRRSYQREILVK